MSHSVNPIGNQLVSNIIGVISIAIFCIAIIYYGMRPESLPNPGKLKWVAISIITTSILSCITGEKWEANAASLMGATASVLFLFSI